LLWGFIASCVLHSAAFAAFFYWPDEAGIKAEVSAPTKLSLNLFAPESAKDDVAELKPQLKPKREKPKKIEQKPAPAEPITVAEPVINEVAEEDTNESVEDLIEQVAQVAAAASESERESYEMVIRAALEKHKTYPSRARAQNLKGTVYVRLVIGDDGNLIDASILQSSGYTLLDRHTLRSVRQASRDFPAPPTGSVSFSVPLSYELI
jgi:protein TonB